MKIEDTVGDVYIKPENCDWGLTGGCEKCRGVFIPKYRDTYTFNPEVHTLYYYYYYGLPNQPLLIKCPNCGKTLKPHICSGED